MWLLWLVGLLACGPSDPCGDLDGDGICDEEDDDRDGDGCANGIDPVDGAATDLDLDGIGDDCDLCLGVDALGDLDGDGVCAQRDADDDGDGCLDEADPNIAVPFEDVDQDGFGSDCDPCDGSDATDDLDLDGICDSEDVDVDGDGCVTENDPNPRQADPDLDGDGIADVCDRDVDGDGCDDNLDLRPTVVDVDGDGDGIADVCDQDRDNDGCDDSIDPRPERWSPFSDGDLLGDDCDDDDDDDGCLDLFDPRPTIAGNHCAPCPVVWDPLRTGDCYRLDADADGDGCADVWDRNPAVASVDLDGDGLADDCDHDDDGDGCVDAIDLVDDLDWSDGDGDGVGDACDGSYDILLAPSSVRGVWRTANGPVLRGADHRAAQLRSDGSFDGRRTPWLSGEPAQMLAPCDLDGDGLDEVIEDFSVRSFAEGEHGFGLEVRPSWWKLGSAGCWDLDQDGTDEIVGMVVGGTSDYVLAVWNARGALLDHASQTWASFDVWAGQIDDDPQLELLQWGGRVFDGLTLARQPRLTDAPREVRAVDLGGPRDALVVEQLDGLSVRDDDAVRWSLEVDDPNFVAGDFLGTGEPVVVVSTDDGRWLVVDALTGTILHETRGARCETWWPVELDGAVKMACGTADEGVQDWLDPHTGQRSPLVGQGATATRPQVGDLDGDGVPEVLWSSSPTPGGTAVLRSLDGTLLDLLDGRGCYLLQDMDGDGDLEVLFDHGIWDYDPASGFVERGQILPPTVALECLLGVGDVTGDGRDDVLYAVNGAGQLLDGGRGSISTLDGALGYGLRDVDGDGVLEVLTQTRESFRRQHFPRSSLVWGQGTWVSGAGRFVAFTGDRWAEYGVGRVFPITDQPLPFERVSPSPIWVDAEHVWYLSLFPWSVGREIVGVGPGSVLRYAADASVIAGASHGSTLWLGTEHGARRLER